MSKLSFLCVHAEETICRLVSEVFADVEVVSAATIEAARALMEEMRFDLYLLHERVMNGSGVDLCRFIKEKDPDKPVLFVGGSARISPHEMCAASAHGHVPLGSSFVTDLEAKVEEALER
jgi:DNA-binding NtrC family response regulator